METGTNQNMEIYGIYHVNRPDFVQYVGQASRGMKKRFSDHLTRARGVQNGVKHTNTQRVTYWIAACGTENVEAFVLEIARDFDHLQELEAKWIARLWSYGMAPFNIDPGGACEPRGPMPLAQRKNITSARSKFKEQDVLDMQQMHLDGSSVREIAARYESHNPTIQRILRGERWGWVRLDGFEYKSAHWKLRPDDVRAIRVRLAAGETHQIISDDYSVCREAITAICRGKSWAWLE